MNHLPVDISLTQCHQAIIFLIHIQVFHKTLTEKVIKTPEQQLTASQLINY